MSSATCSTISLLKPNRPHQDPLTRAKHQVGWIVGLCLLFACELLTQGAVPDVHPKGTNVTSLCVLDAKYMGSNAEKTMIATLQGLVARVSAEQIYIDSGGGYSLWKEHLHSAYGIPLQTVRSPWELVNRFKGVVRGYVLYDSKANIHSLSVANSLSGILNAIAVDASIEAQVQAAGITNRLEDVRTRDSAWAWTNHAGKFSTRTMVEQRETLPASLRDYATLSDSFTFFVGNSPARKQFVSGLEPDPAILGWGDASHGEDVFVGEGSLHGVYEVAADHVLNLSTLSSIRDSSIHQFPPSKTLTETNVHYVCFVMTDGDNVQWNLGGFPGYFNNPVRGSFDMGWSLSPGLADLAPSALRWYYEHSSTGQHRDHFIAGPSGSGYFYPSKYPAAALDLHVRKLGRLMSAADMSIVQILDFGSFHRMDLWNKYFSQPGIEALFYLEYAPYSGAHGQILFSTNGNPVIAARDMLWPGLEEPEQLIKNINSYSRDISSPDAYTMVPVLVWKATQSTVQHVVTNLAPHVRVVTPDRFVRLVRSNVGRRLSYDFSDGLQGWVGGAGGKELEKAQWSESSGHSGGALKMSGSAQKPADDQPNAWFSRQIVLPANATSLRFETLAVNHSKLRVRLQQPDGTWTTLLNWESSTNPNTWVTRSASLRLHAGRTVTLRFEQGDAGQGSEGFRYLDNIKILTTGTPVYPPLPPRLLTAKAGGGVSLTWQANDESEDGFALERRTGLDQPWIEIAKVSANQTVYKDSEAKADVQYFYRIRSQHRHAWSPYSNVQAVPARQTPEAAADLGL